MMPLSEREFQIDQHTGDDVPYVSRRVCEVFRGGLKRTTEYHMSGKACEAGSTVYRPFPRKSESLTVCRCYYKNSTFTSVILRS